MNPLTRRDFIAASTSLALSQRISAKEAPTNETSPEDLTLWYDKPAAQWVDALPIGNGRLGAMVYGGGDDASPSKEVLQFNEDTLWSGKPRDGNNRDAKNYLLDIRKAVLDEQDYQKADQLCSKMQGLFAEAYQPLGNLHLNFTHAGAPTNYRRELNLDTACARTSYTVGDVRFERQAFASAPDQVLVVHAKASQPGQLHCTISLDGPLKKSVSSPGPGRLLLTGKAAAHIAGAGHPGSEKPVVLSNCAWRRYVLRLRFGCLIGRRENRYAARTGSKSPVLPPSANPHHRATGYRGFQSPPDTPLDDVIAKARTQLDSVAKKKFDELQTASSIDRSSAFLFRRVSLHLSPSNDISKKPTGQRIKEVGTSLDPRFWPFTFSTAAIS